MRLQNTFHTTLVAMVLACLAYANSAQAEVLQPLATSSVTSVPSASLYAPVSDPVVLASANYSDSLASLIANDTLLGTEREDRLAHAILPNRRLLDAGVPKVRLDLSKASNGSDDQLAVDEQQRAGFSLSGLFRSREDTPLSTLFIGMLFIGIVIAGVRLEILRRRAEQAAFYGTQLASHHRRSRHRSAVVYAQSPSRVSRSSSHSRRRRSSGTLRRRSSRSDAHSSERRSHRSHKSTHPIVIDSRLAS